MSNYIFLIVGESGSGKTTIVKELEEKYKLTSISSYTTRPKRFPNEYGHTFVTEEEFDSLKNLCGYTEFNGYKYCATSEQVDNNDLYVIDVNGIDYFINHYKGTKTPIVIYISVEKVDRFLRMKARGDTTDKAMERIRNDESTFSNVRSYANYIVKNNNLEEAIEEIHNIINKNN